MQPTEPAGRDGEGGCPETAIPVGSVGEEYAWVARHLPGARLVDQVLTEFEGRPLDVLTLEIEPGVERQVHFDISAFFGLWRKANRASVPCPYCGAALRTDRAKQCFACGMDWRDPANAVRRGRASPRDAAGPACRRVLRAIRRFVFGGRAR